MYHLEITFDFKTRFGVQNNFSSPRFPPVTRQQDSHANRVMSTDNRHGVLTTRESHQKARHHLKGGEGQQGHEQNAARTDKNDTIEAGARRKIEETHKKLHHRPRHDSVTSFVHGTAPHENYDFQKRVKREPHLVSLRHEDGELSGSPSLLQVAHFPPERRRRRLARGVG